MSKEEPPVDALRFCESERQRLERELRDASAAAAAAREELCNIVYAVSHDVKESLRSVASYTQLLVRLHPSHPETVEFGAFITEGVKTAETFINQLNAYSRIDASSRRTWIDLSVVLQMTLLKIAPIVSESGAAVTYRDLPEANIDESQFVTVFQNLIENAIKYRASESVHIEISGEETEQGHLISVLDNGPGIEPEYHELIFQPFKRLHGRKIPGVGLGLAACRKIVEAHRGKIWIESDGQNGSRFRILLPF